MRRENPYITIEASSPLDSRWTPTLWFAWCRLLGTCRLKRACTAESWPAAVLTLRPIEAASILNTTPNWVANVLANLSQVASLTVRKDDSKSGARWVISVDNYAIYQKLGRPTSAKTSADVPTPPYVPTSLRPSGQKNQNPEAAAEPAAVGTDPVPPEPEAAAAAPPWGRMANLLGDCRAKPPPDAEERDEWLRVHWPEIEAATDAELPDEATAKQRGAAHARIALARWRVYLRSDRWIRREIDERREIERLEAFKREVYSRPPPVIQGEDDEIPLITIGGAT